MKKKVYSKPLAGKVIVITRAQEQAGGLNKKLKSLGAQVMELPTIRILPPRSYQHLDRVIEKISSYDWIIFTSANGAEHFISRFKTKRKNLFALRKIKICSIGPATTQKLQSHGLKVNLKPREFTSEGLVEKFRKMDFAGLRVLLPRANLATDLLPKELEKIGANVERIVAYRTVREKSFPSRAGKMLKEGKVDIVTFTSSSTVKNFLSLVGLKNLHPKINFASIGPVTTQTAKELGLKIRIEAKEHTVDGLVETILQNVIK